MGEIIPFKKVFLDDRTQTKKKEYSSSSLQYKGCAMASTCIGKTAKEKKFSVTYYRAEYERYNKRVNSKHGRYLKGKRQSTVASVFGTGAQFTGLRKINTIGIQQANKVMHRTAIAYNLKKCLKFIEKRSKSKAKALGLCQQLQKGLQKLKTTLEDNPKKELFVASRFFFRDLCNGH